MPGAHRNDDKRFCDATTIVQEQSTVYINNKLAAVEGDKDSHNEGQLEAFYGKKNIYINNKLVITAEGDRASPDGTHLPPESYPKESSSDVFYYT